MGRYLGARSWGALLGTPSATALPRCRRRMRKGWRMRKGLGSVVSACDGQRERAIERNREKREMKRDQELAHAHSCFTPLVDFFPNHLAHKCKEAFQSSPRQREPTTRNGVQEREEGEMCASMLLRAGTYAGA